MGGTATAEELSLLGKTISMLHRQEQRHIAAVMRPYGLGSSSYPFLIHLAKQEGLSQRELSRRLAMDEALATRTLRELERLGYVTRQREEADRRAYLLRLTEKGRACTALIRRELGVWWAQVTDGLPPQEVARTGALLDSMFQQARALQTPEAGCTAFSPGKKTGETPHEETENTDGRQRSHGTSTDKSTGQP